MVYWREADFEGSAQEVARWAIYVARNRAAFSMRAEVHQRGLRDDDASGRGGALLEVRADRDMVPEGDFYRIRVRRIASISVTSKRPHSMYTLGFSNQSQPWTKWGAAFQVTVNHKKNEVRFGPTSQLGNLQNEDKGLGVGRYCLAKVIEWAIERYPDYTVAAGSLSCVDASTEMRRNRRNALYEGAGFVVNYSDNDKKIGSFKVSKVSDLSPKWRRGRVREISLYGLIGAFARTMDDRTHYAAKFTSCRDDADGLKAKHGRLVKLVLVLIISFVGFALSIIYRLTKR